MPELKHDSVSKVQTKATAPVSAGSPESRCPRVLKGLAKPPENQERADLRKIMLQVEYRWEETNMKLCRNAPYLVHPPQSPHHKSSRFKAEQIVQEHENNQESGLTVVPGATYIGPGN
jgi:hypothetical protein